MHFSEGNFYDDVELELIKDEGISRPRMRPVGAFPIEMRVEVSRQLRELFPLGTRFKANIPSVTLGQGKWPMPGRLSLSSA